MNGNLIIYTYTHVYEEREESNTNIQVIKSHCATSTANFQAYDID